MTVAIVLAAGSGTRFGGDKVRAGLRGKPLWRWSFDTLLAHPRIDAVGLVVSDPSAYAVPDALFVVAGGSTRQESCALGIAACPQAEIVLIHDAARPQLDSATIDAVLDGIERTGAAAPGVPVADTIRRRSDTGYELVDRSNLLAMQTPQGARAAWLREAHEAKLGDFTDEMELLAAAGRPFEVVPGNPRNFKVTTMEDLERMRGAGEIRTGFGYDIHRFSTDPARACWLGGVRFEDAPGLEGHSDADVLLHAVVDALLGALGLGDIGQHFPNTDPRWSGEPSLTFLRHAATLLAERGAQVVNVDATVVAEKPKVMKKAAEIRAAIAGALEISSDRISVKATTNEGLGAIGRSEGVCASAVATVKL